MKALSPKRSQFLSQLLHAMRQIWGHREAQPGWIAVSARMSEANERTLFGLRGRRRHFYRLYRLDNGRIVILRFVDARRDRPHPSARLGTATSDHPDQDRHLASARNRSVQ
jgi:hypothetical protein